MEHKRFFIERDALEAGVPIESTGEVHHALHVFRLRKGDRIELVDGEGGFAEAVVKSVTRGSIGYEIIHFSRTPAPGGSLHLAFGILKGSSGDVIIRAGTELGVNSFIPVFSERSEVDDDEKRNNRRLARWKRITVSAMKQCGLLHLPSILEPVTLDELTNFSEHYDKLFFGWMHATPESRIPPLDNDTKVLCLTGPEGGFSKSESKLLFATGFSEVYLGPGRLRAETAAVAMCVLVKLR